VLGTFFVHREVDHLAEGFGSLSLASLAFLFLTSPLSFGSWAISELPSGEVPAATIEEASKIKSMNSVEFTLGAMPEPEGPDWVSHFGSEVT